VEVAGVEPASYGRSDEASTCLATYLISHPNREAARWTGTNTDKIRCDGRCQRHTMPARWRPNRLTGIPGGTRLP